MRVLVTGSRDWDDADAIEADIWQVDHDHDGPHTLVHGACPTGADQMAAEFAADMGWTVEAHPADWETHGKRAGFLRNTEMVAAGADLCLAYIKDDSKGATMTLGMAQNAGILSRTRRAKSPAAPSVSAGPSL